MNVAKILGGFVDYSAQLVSKNAGILALGTVGVNHQLQQIRHKSKIKFCGYLEPPAFKQRDIRYKTSTRHDTKRMNWQDYQRRRWNAVHWGKPYPLWQAKMDYAENLCRLGMPTWSIQKMLDLHPHCIEFIKRKLDGNVTLLHEAQFSNFVNHRSGDR